MTPLATTRITYNRDNRDYDCFVAIDGVEEYIGSAPTYHHGEVKLKEYVFNYYNDNHTPEAAVQVLARPAEVVEAKVATCTPTMMNGQIWSLCGALTDGPCVCGGVVDSRLSPDHTTGVFIAPELTADEEAAQLTQRLPVDPTTVAIARTSCASDGPDILNTDRQATVIHLCPLCATDAHRATQCPDVALAQYGMGVWEAYMEDRADFLKLVQWATAQRLALMGEAVAHYLSARWGHDITSEQVLAGWHRNAAPAQS